MKIGKTTCCLCRPLLVGCSQRTNSPCFYRDLTPCERVHAATQMWMEGNACWHSPVLICVFCSIFVCLVSRLFVLSEAALLRSPGFRRKQTTWIVSSWNTAFVSVYSSGGWLGPVAEQTRKLDYGTTHTQTLRLHKPAREETGANRRD